MAGGGPRQAKSGGAADTEPPLDRLRPQMRGLERKRALEFQGGIGGSVGQPEMDADIHRELHVRWTAGVALFVVVTGLDLVVVTAAELMNSVGPMLCTWSLNEPALAISSIAEHFDPDTPTLGEVVFAPPTIFEAKALPDLHRCQSAW